MTARSRTTKHHPTPEAKPAGAGGFDPAGYLKVHLFGDGVELYKAADPADRLMIVKSGRVRIVGSTTGQVLTELLGTDEVCGKLVRLAGATMGETAVAEGDVEIFELAGAQLERFVQERPGPAAALFARLEERRERCSRRLRAFAYKEVGPRMAEMLLDLGEHHGAPCEHGSGEFDLRGVTQQDLADLVGCARPFASTVFNDFKKTGAVRLEGRTICVRDQLALRARSLEEHIRAS